MSYNRPDRVGLPTLLFSRMAMMAGIVLAGVLAVTSLPVAMEGGVAAMLSGTPVGSALFTAAVAITGLFCANKAAEAREYSIKRQDAFIKARAEGHAPVLPKDPFLDPKEQPSKFTTGMLKAGGTMLLLAGLAMFLSFAFDVISVSGAGVADLFPEMKLPPVIGNLNTSFLAGAGLATMGGAAIRISNIAADARLYAEQEFAIHQKHIQLEEQKLSKEYEKHRQQELGEALQQQDGNDVSREEGKGSNRVVRDIIDKHQNREVSSFVDKYLAEREEVREAQHSV